MDENHVPLKVEHAVEPALFGRYLVRQRFLRNNMPPSFSEEQKICACNIRRAFLLKKLRYALLKAYCQSGKTGAYHFLIKKMLDAGDVQRVYILCGSSETILRDQAHEDAISYNRAHMEAGRIQIIFHQDFKHSSMELDNALVILDESHLVQTKGQELHTFLGRHGITMDGNPVNLVSKNTYVVSVDATPYSELAALSHKSDILGGTPYEKHVETLKPGKDYVGLKDFFICGAIRPTYDLTTAAGKAQISALLASQGLKYALMRLSNSNKGGNASEAVVRSICAERGYRVLYFTSDRTEIAITRKEQLASSVLIPCLEDAPTVTTVVILRSRLRAGKVVPKPHIGFVWEGAKASKTDTIVQGLAGRMCGYHAESPLIFVQAAFLERIPNKTIKESEIERAFYGPTMLPRKATNIKKGAVASAPTSGKTACVPLRIEWDGAQLEDLTGDFNNLKKEARELFLRRGLALLDASEHYTTEQKAEIISAATSTETTLHGRHMVSTSSTPYVSFYKQILEGYKAGTASAEGVTDCPEITYIIVEPGFPGLALPGASERHVYVLFYTIAKGRLDRSDVDLGSRIPTTTGKSIFSLDTSRFDRPVAAAGAVGISLEDIKVPEKLELRLRDYLTLWQTSALVVSRSIVAPSGGSFNLSKRHYHYKASGDNDVERMCRRLEVEFGLTKNQLDVKYIRSGKDMFNLKSISW